MTRMNGGRAGSGVGRPIALLESGPLEKTFTSVESLDAC